MLKGPLKVLGRAARSPALHFLFIGGLLFCATSWLDRSSTNTGRERIRLSATQIEDLRQRWTQETGRAPGPQEEQRFIEAMIEEEILYRQALAHGLDRDNSALRNRLVQLARFLTDDPTKDDNALYREALALGLDRSDLVVRRQLVELMRLLARKPSELQQPTEGELQAYLERHPKRFRQASRVRLTHVYLSKTRRGDHVSPDAVRLLKRLNSEHVDPVDAPARGDPFLLGHHLPPKTQSEVARLLGRNFARSVMSLQAGRWLGPVPSSYGLHLVWIHELVPAGWLNGVRAQAIHGVLRERADERLRSRMRQLRARYEIVIEHADEPRPPEERRA